MLHVPPKQLQAVASGPLKVSRLRRRKLHKVLLTGFVLIVGGLTYFPALAVGPIVEHLAMLAGQTF